jgi:hypothetical protein
MSGKHNCAGAAPDDAFLGVLRTAGAKQGLPKVPTTVLATNAGEALRGTTGNHMHANEEDDAPLPLAQSRWFQASAQVVRMTVIEHLEREKARNHVSEQLRVWASEKVQQYSQVRSNARSCLPACTEGRRGMLQQ